MVLSSISTLPVSAPRLSRNLRNSLGVLFPNAQIDFINRPYKNMDISVGKDTYGDNVRIFGLGYEGHSTLKIGERTHIAKNVTLMISSGHELGNPSKHIVHYGDKLEIGNDVWIGYGATILPGCRKIGNNSVIGACAVVTHDVVPYTVVGGNPAKVIKKISKFK